MAYPDELDTITTPPGPDRLGLSTPTHREVHAAVADAIVALETKVGIIDSAPTTVGDVLTVTAAGETEWQTPSGASLTGAPGGVGEAGGSIAISGGTGDDGNDAGASITVGGGTGAGDPGVITITGDMVGSVGNTIQFTGGYDGNTEGPGSFLVNPGETGSPGSVELSAGDAGAGVAGSFVFLEAGDGDGGNDLGAAIAVNGGSGTGAHGTIEVTTGGLTLQVIGGTADPSAGGGVAANVASLYARDNSGTGELWVKTGASDTAWTKVV